MLLTKKSSGTTESVARSPFIRSLQRGLSHALPTMDRRGFLRRSGLGRRRGHCGLVAHPGEESQARPTAEPSAIGQGKIEVKRTVCTHCSVGCAIDAVVENGVWVRQEPVFDSPLNLGSHCAKGAAIREHGHGEFRLRYPMKLVNGKYERISWDTALNEVSAKILELRKASGPDSMYWIGSSKHSNEQSYLLRKFVSLFGSNNCDHQARICHSTTVAGVANTWGYGAMTNSYNDMQNSKCALYIGSNAAEAHPVSMLHMLHAKENGCKMIVVGSALHPHRGEGGRVRAHPLRHRHSRSCSAMLYHIFKNGWEDKKYINDRVYGMDEVKADVMAKWTPDKVEEACGVPEAADVQGCGDDGQEPAVDAGVVHGPDPAHDRQRDGAGLLHRAAGAGQRRRLRRRRQHLPRPRQRAGRHRHRPQPGFAAGLLRHRRRLVAPLRQGLGRGLRVDQGPLRKRRR